ncbi:MAG: GWxTD domain-containing protein [Balneolaceae bacterium]
MLKRYFSLFAILLLATPVLAQRSNKVDYVNLANRANAPQIFIDDIILPTEDGKASLSLIFRFDNDFLPYKKISPSDDIIAPEGMEFFTIARLNSEIFKGRISRRNSSNVETVSRDLWTDTLYTKTFAETESKNLYASGSLSNTLDPGDYNYVLQLSLMENTRDRNSNRQNVRIWDWKNKPTGEIYLIKEKTEDERFRLMNLDDNVLFGQDFKALVRIPKYSDELDYTVEVFKARPNQKDTLKAESIYKSAISNQEVRNGVIPILSKNEEPTLSYKETDMDFNYVLLTIPNSTFENSAYILEIKSSDSNNPIARTFFRSYWQNMPASLLNLDIAIENMKFIVGENEIKRLKSGNSQEKEKKFRAFWDSKDPTPNTVYNELMAEYYRRVDFAFKEYRNPGNPIGYESDQGEIYIKFGPPDSKERQFPTNGKVLEVWKYPNRTFLFERTTGFGDFVLLKTE